MTKTYTGSCRCGRVCFGADIELSEPTGKCNHSICSKSRFWGVLVKLDAFRLKSARDELGNYQLGNRIVRHLVCRHRGARSFGRGYPDVIGGGLYTVNIACVDGVDANEFAAAPLGYAEGGHNRCQSAPALRRHW